MCIRPGTGCVSDLVQGVYQTWCRVCIRPGKECAIVHQNLVQGMLSTDTCCVLDLGCRYGVYIRPSAEHVSDQVPGVLYIRLSAEHVSDRVQGVHQT